MTTVHQAYAVVPITKCHVGTNVRIAITDLDELAESIRKLGILQPLIGCPAERGEGHIEILMGQRRLTAAKRAGLTEVPVVLRQRPSDRDRVLLQLAENLERADMSPIEEGEAFAKLSNHGLTQVQIAAAIGRSNAFVSMRTQLLALPEVLRGALHARLLSPTVALSVPRAFFDNPEAVARLVERFRHIDTDERGDAATRLRSWAHDESAAAHAAGLDIVAKYSLDRPVSLPIEHLRLAKNAAEAEGGGMRAWIRTAIEEKAARAGFALEAHEAAAKRTIRPARERVA